jgi:hypothetical protein
VKGSLRAGDSLRREVCPAAGETCLADRAARDGEPIDVEREVPQVRTAEARAQRLRCKPRSLEVPYADRKLTRFGPVCSRAEGPRADARRDEALTDGAVTQGKRPSKDTGRPCRRR